MPAADDRPRPPPEIQGEALLEWERVCDELSLGGLLHKTDRAVLVVYCQTWGIYQDNMRSVVAHGAVVKWQNGVAGQSPFFKTTQETGRQLQRLLAELGLTPAARHRMRTAAAELPVDDMEI